MKRNYFPISFKEKMLIMLLRKMSNVWFSGHPRNINWILIRYRVATLRVQFHILLCSGPDPVADPDTKLNVINIYLEKVLMK